jgi:hypothetical protein
VSVARRLDRRPSFEFGMSSKYPFSLRTSYWNRSKVPMIPFPRGSIAMMCSRLVSTTRPMATSFISSITWRMMTKASWPTLPSGAM